MGNTQEAPSGTHTWLVLMKAYRTLMCHAERSFEMADIGLTDFVVLEMLLHKGPQKVNDIGRAAALTSGAITAAVDRVEKHGLVVRTLDPNDRRARVVRLTPKGETLIRTLFDRHVPAMERATSGLTDSERSTLVGLLKKLGLSAQQLLAAPEEQA
jgi:MarR family transcriptional regulator, 2-MHQ and catechol-resistance regulon repressor